MTCPDEHDIPTLLHQIAAQLEGEREVFAELQSEAVIALDHLDRVAGVWGDQKAFGVCRERLREALKKARGET